MTDIQKLCLIIIINIVVVINSITYSVSLKKSDTLRYLLLKGLGYILCFFFKKYYISLLRLFLFNKY